MRILLITEAIAKMFKPFRHKMIFAFIFLHVLQTCLGRTDDFDDITSELSKGITNVLHLSNDRRMQEETEKCSELISNGSWGTLLGGKLRQLEEGLEAYDRTLPDGPSYSLDPECLEEGHRYLLTAKIQAKLGTDLFLINKYSNWKDRTFLTAGIQFISENGETKTYTYPNEDPSSWSRVIGEWNIYRAFIDVDSALATSKEAYFYFNGPRAGISIIFTDVSIERYLIPQNKCNKPLFYATAEDIYPFPTELHNWRKGSLDVVDGGAQNTTHAFMSHKRGSMWDGVEIRVEPSCLFLDVGYEVEMYIKLMDWEGKIYSCDKNVLSIGRHNSCPNLGIWTKNGDPKVTYEWNYYKPWISWKPNKFNLLRMRFDATERMVNADSLSIIIRNIPRSTSLIFDNLRFGVACDMLFLNSYAERGVTTFFEIVDGGGSLRLSNRAYDGRKAFIHSGRTSADNGVGQQVDPFCTKEGRKFEFIAQVLVLDTTNESVTVDKWANPGDDTYLVLTIRLTLPSGEVKSMDYQNEDRSEWDKTKHNIFRAVFTADGYFEEATQVLLYLRGPKKGYSIVFDDAIVPRYEEKNCYDELLIGDDDENNRSLGWRLSQPSYLNRLISNDGKKRYYEHTHRAKDDPGIVQDIDPACFFEGQEYVFAGEFKLTDKDKKPLQCSNDVRKVGDPNACPVVAFRLEHDSEIKWIYHWFSGDWSANEWNSLNFAMFANEDFTKAKSIQMIVTGPGEDVNLLFDQVDFQGYWPSTAPSILPSFSPSTNPTHLPSGPPSSSPTAVSSPNPSGGPSDTRRPSVVPSVSARPSLTPTVSLQPTFFPSATATAHPSAKPTSNRSLAPSRSPSDPPTGESSVNPTSGSSLHPSKVESVHPTSIPSLFPSMVHSNLPTISPSANHTSIPSVHPSILPTANPSKVHSSLPSHAPSFYPTIRPSNNHSEKPTNAFSTFPTEIPSQAHSILPTLSLSPSDTFSEFPTSRLSEPPTGKPSAYPSNEPSSDPSSYPTNGPSSHPSSYPTGSPSETPSEFPTLRPSELPSRKLSTNPTNAPSMHASLFPSGSPTEALSNLPTVHPTTYKPSTISCETIVRNGHAEEQNTKGWRVSGGGNLEIINEGADGSRHSFRYYNRPSHLSGPEQRIFQKCLEAGETYKFTAKVTLRDDKDNRPYFCNHLAAWRDDLFCPILTIIVTDGSGTKKINFGNDDSSLYRENEFNTFETVFSVDPFMIAADELSFLLRGPKAGVSLIVDDVSIIKHGSGQIRTCNELIRNGDIQNGIEPWTATHGSVLELQKMESSTDNLVLKNIQRTTSYSGVRQELNTHCIISGIFLEFNAMLKLLDERGVPMGCNKTIRTSGHQDICPSARLEVVGLDTKYNIPVPNEDSSDWVAGNFNSYVSVIEAPNLNEADRVSLIIDGVRPGVTILLDDVSLDETIAPMGRGEIDSLLGDDFYGQWQNHNFEEGGFVDFQWFTSSPTKSPVLDTNAMFNSLSFDVCSELISNGDAELGTTDGWSAAFGGEIGTNDHGANGSGTSFESYGRFTSFSGPKHYFDVSCFQLGTKFELNAYIKLKNRYGEPFDCDKHAKWGENSFLTASLYLEKSSGDEIIDLANEDPSQWNAIDYNLYRSLYTVTPNFNGVTRAYLYFRGPGAGITIEFDEVSLSRYNPPQSDCSELIKHGKAEDGKLHGWSLINSDGYIDLSNLPRGGVSFESGGRSSQYSGPRYELDMSCFQNNEYQFEAKFMLLTSDGSPVICDKDAVKQDASNCPVVTIEFTKQQKTIFVLENIVGTRWKPGDFNRYFSTFAMTEELKSSDKAAVYINGPLYGVSILFNDVSLREYQARDCENLVINGGAEDGTIEPWVSFLEGSIRISKGGANGSDHAFMNLGRTKFSYGPLQRINMDCLVDGTSYEFKAMVKLTDEAGNPFYCYQDVEWRDDNHCIILSIIVLDSRSEDKVLNLANESPSYWDEYEFNDFHATFIVDEEMLTGESISFMLRGPRKGVSIIFDDVSIKSLDMP